ncbi:phosphoglycerate mutase [Pseudomonas sp. 43NM1]|uniref:histidine phosphatase family protein n=1 Tax=Pseudomonas sp. 43NM1 TaxID=1904755 RepID=UPI000C34ED27|nr:histidine phosphatase family protein [Pseudomonas sp. 43NM1]PKH12502.1 phosphoglycerate mutase [Pseudomonas sp. 43NM1]
MQATRLTLICHARTVAQKLARFPADESVEIDWQSAKSCRRDAGNVAPILLCGPEARTRQTAELFGNDAQVVEALRDCDFGRWQGQRLSDLQKHAPEALSAWLDDADSAPHGGESVNQLSARVAAWLTTLEAQPGQVIAVTHPYVIRAALAHVLQSPATHLVDVEPLSALELRFTGRWRLRLMGTAFEGAI